MHVDLKSTSLLAWNWVNFWHGQNYIFYLFNICLDSMFDKITVSHYDFDKSTLWNFIKITVPPIFLIYAAKLLVCKTKKKAKVM